MRRVWLSKFISGIWHKEGPPDLDEVMRDLSRKINSVFGRGSPRSAPSAGQKSGLPISAILAVVFLIWCGTGFYIVDQGSLGVVQRFGRYVETTEPGPRWHFPYPIEKATVVNMGEVRRLEVGYRSSGEGSGSKVKRPQEALMLTEDENIIDLQFAVQYNLKSATDYLFNNRAVDDAVLSAAESAIREVVGKNKLDDLLQKGLADTSLRMQAILDSYKTGIRVISVSLQGARPPEQVQEAFEDVNRANQDNQRQVNEGQAYANDVIPRARGAASRLLAEAAGYKLKVESEARGNASRFEQVLVQYQSAPEVTRQRLFLDANEQILSQVSKIVVDQHSTNNLLYLPLDKLITQARQTTNDTETGILNVPSSAEKPGGTTTDQQRGRDALRSRGRESR